MDVNPICEQKCAKYSYWWSYKASFLSQERFKLDKCVKKCVKDFNDEFSVFHDQAKGKLASSKIGSNCSFS